tara:strand:+ start:400 stop:696 length:297 start_codon:yes stop_codon:yes gene_type:complete
MIYNKFHALKSLKPNGVFEWIGTEYSGLTGSDKPTEAELDAEVIRLQADYDSKKYQRDREIQYPSLQEQLDLQYWDQVNGTTKWKEAIAKVKSDNPKP